MGTTSRRCRARACSWPGLVACPRGTEQTTSRSNRHKILLCNMYALKILLITKHFLCNESCGPGPARPASHLRGPRAERQSAETAACPPRGSGSGSDSGGSARRSALGFFCFVLVGCLPPQPHPLHLSSLIAARSSLAPSSLLCCGAIGSV